MRTAKELYEERKAAVAAVKVARGSKDGTWADNWLAEKQTAIERDLVKSGMFYESFACSEEQITVLCKRLDGLGYKTKYVSPSSDDNYFNLCIWFRED